MKLNFEDVEHQTLKDSDIERWKTDEQTQFTA